MKWFMMIDPQMVIFEFMMADLSTIHLFPWLAYKRTTEWLLAPDCYPFHSWWNATAAFRWCGWWIDVRMMVSKLYYSSLELFELNKKHVIDLKFPCTTPAQSYTRHQKFPFPDFVPKTYIHTTNSMFLDSVGEISTQSLSSIFPITAYPSFPDAAKLTESNMYVSSS